MSTKYKHLFNLPDNFTKDQLKSSYITKLFEIQNNHQLKETDKFFIIDQYKELYNQAKYDIYVRDQQLIPLAKPIQQVESYYSSYQSITNKDGITHVKKVSESKNNDKITKNNIEYKIDKNGRKMYITN